VRKVEEQGIGLHEQARQQQGLRVC
jgi:hypothetical protein